MNRLNINPIIIENPTKEDYKKLEDLARQETPSRILDKIRFMANAHTKKVYVADAYNSMHRLMSNKLCFSFNKRESCPWIYFGSASLNNSVATNIPHKFYSLSSQLNYNWSFVDNYILNFEYDLWCKNGRNF